MAWRRRIAGLPRWRRILYALLSLMLVAAACTVGGLLWTHLQKPDTCTDGIERVDGECIGVDGEGYDFGTPEISDVAAAIAAENDRITGPYITVAMMLPLQSKQAELRRQMRSDLIGAFLGQREVNKAEGEPPRIRLVLANPGRGYAHQEDVVDTLLEMAESPEDRLRAVTGFNLSLEATKAAVTRLTEEHVPVLASRISGDGFANKEQENGSSELEFPGLARIIPTNHDAAQALANFNGEERRQDSRTVLVYDKRPKDSYNESLKSAFGAIKEYGPPGPDAMPFRSPALDEPGSTGTRFTQLANNICDSTADTVYFAGRTLHLRLFALKLAKVTCNDNRHFTVVSGSDAASLQQSMKKEDWAALRGADGAAKVTVEYAAPAHPDSWSTELDRWRDNWDRTHDRKPDRAELPQYLTEPKAVLDALEKQLEEILRNGPDLGLDKSPKAPGAAPDTPREVLEDSRTMLVYDGLLTIGQAVHQVQAGGAKVVPSGADIGEQWGVLNLRYRVKGTSGLICLSNSGNAYDKPVSVVRLDPGRKALGELRFVGLGWPTGEVQQRNCQLPSSRD